MKISDGPKDPYFNLKSVNKNQKNSPKVEESQVNKNLLKYINLFE